MEELREGPNFLKSSPILEATPTLLTEISERTGLWPGLIVPAIILLLALLFSGAILLATRMRQNRFDSNRRDKLSLLEKDKQIISKIYYALDKEITPDNIEEIHQETLHYAWMLAHEKHLKFTSEIREYDSEKLKNFEAARADLKAIQEKARTLMGE